MINPVIFVRDYRLFLCFNGGMLRNPDSNNIYSVSTLNQSVANLLEREFGFIWVQGEISNLAQPASGHIYFSLKDNATKNDWALVAGFFAVQLALIFILAGDYSRYKIFLVL